MKKSYQVIILAFAALVVAGLFNWVPTATVIMTYKNMPSTAASSFIPITSAPGSRSTTTSDSSGGYMTVSITNMYRTPWSLFFTSNAYNPPMRNRSTSFTFGLQPYVCQLGEPVKTTEVCPGLTAL